MKYKILYQMKKRVMSALLGGTSKCDVCNGTDEKRIPIFGVEFNGKRDKFGDFAWMINQTNYENSLFIFNDNEEDHSTPKKGGGNAKIRPYNKHGYQALGLPQPRSAGISTGTLAKGGYGSLSDDVKLYIDECVREIKDLLRRHEYDSIYFSIDGNEGLGTGIFKVDEKVKEYIKTQILSLSSGPVTYIKPTD